MKKTPSTLDDFGFLTYDEQIDDTPTQIIADVDTSGLEAKIDLLTTQNEVIAKRLSEMSSAPSSATHDDDFDDQMLLEAYELMAPLLQGLIDTSNKDWIHWPNRRPILESKLAELKRITGA